MNEQAPNILFTEKYQSVEANLDAANKEADITVTSYHLDADGKPQVDDVITRQIAEETQNSKNGKFCFWLVVILFGLAVVATWLSGFKW